MTALPPRLGRLGRSVSNLWIGRRRRADPAALAAVAGRRPAVVITGASAGIGRALAIELARRVEAVVLVARRQAPLDEVAQEIRARSTAVVVTLALDLTRPDAAAVIEAAASAAGLYVDKLVNNAGMGLSGAFVGQPADAIDGLVALNVAVPTRLMRHFLPAMLERGRGGLLNVASLGGYAPGPYQAAYYASKAHVIALTRAVAWEERGRGVRIAVVAPGPVETGFHAAMQAERSLYRLLIPAPSASAVARSTVRGYDWGCAAIHPGLLATPAAMFLSVMPRLLLLPLIAGLLWPRRSAG